MFKLYLSSFLVSFSADRSFWQCVHFRRRFSHEFRDKAAEFRDLAGIFSQAFSLLLLQTLSISHPIYFHCPQTRNLMLLSLWNKTIMLDFQNTSLYIFWRVSTRQVKMAWNDVKLNEGSSKPFFSRPIRGNKITFPATLFWDLSCFTKPFYFVFEICVKSCMGSSRLKVPYSTVTHHYVSCPTSN